MDQGLVSALTAIGGTAAGLSVHLSAQRRAVPYNAGDGDYGSETAGPVGAYMGRIRHNGRLWRRRNREAATTTRSTKHAGKRPNNDSRSTEQALLNIVFSTLPSSCQNKAILP